ncbi:MAG: HAD-IIIC family phosphatase [bacterium]|nr:HAD-IIIC family phosphatase [bacterium]
MAIDVKCVVWDLDNTVWDGILSEDIDVELKPGIIDIIQSLDDRGILNSIASKNNFDDAINKLKDFGLNDYFLYPEINWNPKSSMIKKISENMNINLDTFLFVDDQSYELDEVKYELDNVLCVNALEYKDLLVHPRLNPTFVTEDSKRRRLMYLENMDREKDEDVYEGPSDNFLKSLNMEFYIKEAEEKDLMRAEELTVRSNQLNATGITYSYEELDEYRKSDTHKLFICELVDKYGSYGKIGLALIDIRKEWHLKLLLMSCRVMARGLGTVLLSFIMNKAKENNGKLNADFRITDRNRQMYIAYKFAGFVEVGSKSQENVLFENNLTRIQDIPSYIKIIE